MIVFAQDPARWTVQTRYLAAVRPGPDDLFHARLLPGDYYAVAMSDVETGAWTDAEFLSHARDRATKFIDCRRREENHRPQGDASPGAFDRGGPSCGRSHS